MRDPDVDLGFQDQDLENRSRERLETNHLENLTTLMLLSYQYCLVSALLCFVIDATLRSDVTTVFLYPCLLPAVMESTNVSLTVLFLWRISISLLQGTFKRILKLNEFTLHIFTVENVFS